MTTHQFVRMGAARSFTVESKASVSKLVDYLRPAMQYDLEIGCDPEYVEQHYVGYLRMIAMAQQGAEISRAADDQGYVLKPGFILNLLRDNDHWTGAIPYKTHERWFVLGKTVDEIRLGTDTHLMTELISSLYDEGVRK